MLYKVIKNNLYGFQIKVARYSAVKAKQATKLQTSQRVSPNTNWYNCNRRNNTCKEFHKFLC
jgi:hypothetical protein